jgi:hypothetical protein
VFKKYSQMKLQMKREALAKLNRRANEIGSGFGTVQGQSGGVTPSVETNGYWHTCRSMIFRTQTTSSPSEWSSAGEAAAGSAGEQPAKE